MRLYTFGGYMRSTKNKPDFMHPEALKGTTTLITGANKYVIHRFYYRHEHENTTALAVVLLLHTQPPSHRSDPNPFTLTLTLTRSPQP